MNWIPACAGMTGQQDSEFLRNYQVFEKDRFIRLLRRLDSHTLHFLEHLFNNQKAALPEGGRVQVNIKRVQKLVG